MQVLDGGRALRRRQSSRGDPVRRGAGRQPATDAPPQTILGAEQKAWFKDRLRDLVGDLEDLGQLAGRAGPARRPAEPAGRPDQGALAGARGYANWAAATTAPPTSSAARSTTSCATRGSPASRSSPATGTASGRAMRPRPCRPGKFEPVGLTFVGAIALERRRDGGQRAQFPEGPSAAAAVPRRPARRRQAGVDVQHAAEARRALVPRVREELRPRRALARCPTRRSRPTSSSSTWAATATRRCGCPPTRCAPSSSASRARSRAASGPTAVRCAIGSSTARHSGSPESGPSCAARSSREIRDSRSKTCRRSPPRTPRAVSGRNPHP